MKAPHTHKARLDSLSARVDRLSSSASGLTVEAVKSLCSQCLSQIAHRQTMSDPRGSTTRQVADMAIIPGYRACQECAAILGTADLDQLVFPHDQT